MPCTTVRFVACRSRGITIRVTINGIHISLIYFIPCTCRLSHHTIYFFKLVKQTLQELLPFHFPPGQSSSVGPPCTRLDDIPPGSGRPKHDPKDRTSHLEQNHVPGRQQRPHGPSVIFSGLRERQCAVPQGMDHPQVDGRTEVCPVPLQLGRVSSSSSSSLHQSQQGPAPSRPPSSQYLLSSHNSTPWSHLCLPQSQMSKHWHTFRLTPAAAIPDPTAIQVLTPLPAGTTGWSSIVYPSHLVPASIRKDILDYS
ncbi:hypothetical protein AB205_0060900 [Aquarana catesbeiana]|uniref:Uncharacterized protein n=1 Tax=Aquarana catesbeiana TaxID=8400 RepID=A0A2G9SDX9_AQUCT|nr:hypothetical protein AB205_0060900 [Aquarana catesbeiana]